ncbi:uncharacterized protein EI97DRAFT_403853, partial [Westerdykella ornata]
MSQYTDNQSTELEKGALSPTALPFSTRYRSLHRRILRILVPSFLQTNPTATRDVKRATDFLDGMRGYAAFAVYICHYIMPTHPKAHTGFGGNNGANDSAITQLPILRLIYSGHFCVCLFFVISGFSVSLKPVKLARKGQLPEFLDAMVSATFRRACRLYLPCLAMLGITFVLACCGAFDFMFALVHNWPFLSKPLRVPVVHPTVWKQFRDFASQVWKWSDPWALSGAMNRSEKHIPYGVQLWTIPVELSCSFISFLCLIGLAKTRPLLRVGIVNTIGAYFLFRGHPEVTLFLAGTTLAEVYLLGQERVAAELTPPAETRKQKIQASLAFLAGLYLASYPPKYAQTSPFSAPLYYLASLIATDDNQFFLYFYNTIASVLLVYVVSISPFLQGLVTTPLGRYLGKISFALYCVHQALINWFGYRSMLFFWSLTGNETTFRYELGLGIAWVFQTIATIWAADMFWRYVD